METHSNATEEDNQTLKETQQFPDDRPARGGIFSAPTFPLPSALVVTQVNCRGHGHALPHFIQKFAQHH